MPPNGGIFLVHFPKSHFFANFYFCAAKSPNPIGNPISPRRVEWGMWRGECIIKNLYISIPNYHNCAL